MTEESDVPTQHINFIQLIENNDQSVVAQLLEDEYVPQHKIKQLTQTLREKSYEDGVEKHPHYQEIADLIEQELL